MEGISLWILIIHKLDEIFRNFNLGIKVWYVTKTDEKLIYFD